MNQEIIDKLSLKPTNFTMGASFVNGIIYVFCDTVYCSALDFNGDPLNTDAVLFFITRAKGKGPLLLAVELIMDMPIEQIKSLLQNHYEISLYEDKSGYSVGPNGELIRHYEWD